jgi:hypothetical protein
MLCGCFASLFLLHCSVYLLGADLPPDVAWTVTIGEGYICFYQSIAANRVLSTRQIIGTQGQNSLGLFKFLIYYMFTK